MYFHHQNLFKALKLTFSSKYFSLRHALLSVVFILLFLILRAFVWCVRLLDHVFYPAFKKQKVTAPIYIIGNPRSGTTFTHRLISKDNRYSHFELFHTIFPAVTFYKVFAAAGKVDALLGSPFARLLNAISRKGFQGWDKIHKTGPKEVESDEMLFVYAMLSPLLGLLFPFFGELEGAKFADKLPPEKRRKLMAYYKDCLKRHMFATGPDKILLEKVALIAGRLGSILELLPDMRIIYLVRHPYESIPSLISMYQVPWKTLAPEALKDSQASREVAAMIFEYYRYLLEFKRKLPEERFIEVRYTDLVADPKGTVERVYSKLRLPMTEEYRQVLEVEAEKARKYKSRHQYSLEDFGLSKEMVYKELEVVFREYGFEP